MNINLVEEHKRNNFFGWIGMGLASVLIIVFTKNWNAGIWILLLFILYALIYLGERMEDLKYD